MELTKFWADNKKLIINAALVVFTWLLLILFFDTILLGAFLVVVGVAAPLLWNYLSKKHGGAKGVLDAFLKEMGVD